ncbi:MAG TPA: hypothetical protein VF131_16875 [Blastocatellia bacterium]|nr:hypothetical protein [Blastocatellia bacterium]
MTKPTTEDRIKVALDHGLTKEYFIDFLKSLLENARYADEKFQRSIFLLLLSMLAFEFLLRASIPEASIGPFKLTDLSPLQKFTPVVVAYFYYSTSSLGVMRRYLVISIESIIKIFYQPAWDNYFSYLQLPPSSFVVEELIDQYSKGLFSKVRRFMQAIIAFTVLIMPLAFEVYAYYQCFYRFGIKDFFTWASLAASIPMLVGAVGIVYHFLQEME